MTLRQWNQTEQMWTNLTHDFLQSRLVHHSKLVELVLSVLHYQIGNFITILAVKHTGNSNWGVHTRHFKCTWSVFEVHLKRTCVWTDRNGSCCTWLIVLSRHGNLKTSKSRSALSSMVSTLLESALIQSKHRKLITNLSVTWSDQFHSRAREQNFVVDYRELWRFINSHRRMISST